MKNIIVTEFIPMLRRRKGAFDEKAKEKSILMPYGVCITFRCGIRLVDLNNLRDVLGFDTKDWEYLLSTIYDFSIMEDKNRVLRETLGSLKNKVGMVKYRIYLRFRYPQKKVSPEKLVKYGLTRYHFSQSSGQDQGTKEKEKRKLEEPEINFKKYILGKNISRRILTESLKPENILGELKKQIQHRYNYYSNDLCRVILTKIIQEEIEIPL